MTLCYYCLSVAKFALHVKRQQVVLQHPLLLSRLQWRTNQGMKGVYEHMPGMLSEPWLSVEITGACQNLGSLLRSLVHVGADQDRLHTPFMHHSNAAGGRRLLNWLTDQPSNTRRTIRQYPCLKTTATNHPPAAAGRRPVHGCVPVSAPPALPS
jgi:hypothetical protein